MITRPITRYLTTTAVLASVLIVTACGADAGQGDMDPSAELTAPAATTPSPESTTEATESADAEISPCDVLTTAEVSALLEDVLREPRVDKPNSNSLGACSWTADNNGRTLYISARTLDQWEPSLAYDDFGVEPIDGLGARAYRTSDDGLFLDPGDSTYFYQLFVIGLDGNIDFDMGVAAAGLLLE